MRLGSTVILLKRILMPHGTRPMVHLSNTAALQAGHHERKQWGYIRTDLSGRAIHEGEIPPRSGFLDFVPISTSVHFRGQTHQQIITGITTNNPRTLRRRECTLEYRVRLGSSSCALGPLASEMRPQAPHIQVNSLASPCPTAPP